MTDRSPTRPQLRRGLGVAMSSLLLAGSLFVPAVVLASGTPPEANDDNLNATEDTPKVIAASELLANDSDLEDVLTVTLVENPLSGTVQLVGSTITFTPDADKCSPAETFRFEYEISDGSNGPDHATVNLTVACTNDNPQAEDDVAHGHQDDPVVLQAGDITDNDFDVDEDALSVTAVSDAHHGSVNLVGTTITFTPDGVTCNPTDGDFDYTVSDGHGGTDTGNVIVELTCSGTNHDPVAANDLASGTEDTNVVLTSATLTANDTDADGDTLTVVSTSNLTGGTATVSAGTVTFTPTHNLCGTNVAGFNYTVSDGTDDDFAHVTISLTCVNDAPVTVADHAIVAQNSGQADYNVLANDSDPEGSALTLVNATGDPSIGTVSVVAGKVRYTPAAAFHGEAVITYTASDGSLQSPGTLTVTVGADDFPPVVTGPAVAFGKGKVDDTAPLRISWNAIDNGVGVKDFKVQAKTGDGKWKTISDGKATNVTKAFPFGEDLRFRVKATDKAGNTSAWKTSDVRRIVDTTHKSSKVKYTGSWTQVSGANKYAYTTKRDNSARLSTTGRQILYVAPKTSASGFVQVFVDGNLVGRFDLSANSPKYDRIIAKATLAGGGTHLIRIVDDSPNSKRTNLSDFVVLK